MIKFTAVMGQKGPVLSTNQLIAHLSNLFVYVHTLFDVDNNQQGTQ